MKRNTEPKLTVTDEMVSGQRNALRLFTKVTRDTPDITKDTLSAFGELSRKPPKSLTAEQRLALRSVRQMLETKADLESVPDPETAEAMRRAIANVDSGDSDGRRLARPGAYAMGIEAWQIQNPTQIQPSVQLESETREQQNDSSAA
jgi:hypothetical protein